MATTKSSSEAELLLAIRSVTEEVQVLRQVVDELREEVQWANRNPPSERAFTGGDHTWNCSLDPASTDFPVNSVDKATVDRLRSEIVAGDRLPEKQGKLFN